MVASVRRWQVLPSAVNIWVVKLSMKMKGTYVLSTFLIPLVKFMRSVNIHLITSIILVHGLRGHRRRTWTKNGVFWPKDLLPSQIHSVRVITYGYDATALVPFGSSSLNNIHHHAKSMVEAVSTLRKDKGRLRTTIVRSFPFSGLVPRFHSILL